MKKRIFITVISILININLAKAEDDKSIYYFVGGGAGYSDLELDEDLLVNFVAPSVDVSYNAHNTYTVNEFSLELNGGVLFKGKRQFVALSFETDLMPIEYKKNSIKTKIDFFSAPDFNLIYDIKAEYRKLAGLEIKYGWNVLPNKLDFYVAPYIRGGVGYSNLSVSYSDATLTEISGGTTIPVEMEKINSDNNFLQTDFGAGVALFYKNMAFFAQYKMFFDFEVSGETYTEDLSSLVPGASAEINSDYSLFLGSVFEVNLSYLF